MYVWVCVFVCWFCFVPIGQNKGIELRSGSVLIRNISKCFCEERIVHDLATDLLTGDRYPLGGSGFIHNHLADAGPRDWNKMACVVLNEWCTQSLAFGADLFQVLKSVLPVAARDFEEALFGTKSKYV